MTTRSKYIQIEWTCGSMQEAKEIAHALVERKLVACANIISPIVSIYFWDGKVATDQEVKVLFKTKEQLFDKVKSYIEEHASYDVPAILALPIVNGNTRYFKWFEKIGNIS